MLSYVFGVDCDKDILNSRVISEKLMLTIMEMCIKITVTNHYTSITIAKLIKAGNRNKCWQGSRETRSPIDC